jgi:hypothetical protein
MRTVLNIPGIDGPSHYMSMLRDRLTKAGAVAPAAPPTVPPQAPARQPSCKGKKGHSPAPSAPRRSAAEQAAADTKELLLRDVLSRPFSELVEQYDPVHKFGDEFLSSAEFSLFTRELQSDRLEALHADAARLRAAEQRRLQEKEAEKRARQSAQEDEQKRAREREARLREAVMRVQEKIEGARTEVEAALALEEPSTRPRRSTQDRALFGGAVARNQGRHQQASAREKAQMHLEKLEEELLRLEQALLATTGKRAAPTCARARLSDAADEDDEAMDEIQSDGTDSEGREEGDDEGEDEEDQDEGEGEEDDDEGEGGEEDEGEGEEDDNEGEEGGEEDEGEGEEDDNEGEEGGEEDEGVYAVSTSSFERRDTEALCLRFMRELLESMLRRYRSDMPFLEACTLLNPTREAMRVHRQRRQQYTGILLERLEGFPVGPRTGDGLSLYDLDAAVMGAAVDTFFACVGPRPVVNSAIYAYDEKTPLTKYYGELLGLANVAETNSELRRARPFFKVALQLLALIPTSVICEQYYSKYTGIKRKDRHSLGAPAMSATMTVSGVGPYGNLSKRSTLLK